MESQPLLSAKDPIPPKQSLDTKSETDVPKTTCMRRISLVEHVFFVYCFVVSGSGPVVEQYLYSRFKEQYPEAKFRNLTSGQNATSRRRPCEAVNNSDSAYVHIIELVQSETSRWLNYLDIERATFQLLSTLLLSAYSDLVGRRLVLILPCSASVVKMAVILATVWFRLPVYCLLFGEACEGLCGGLLTMKTSAVCYIADTTTPENRGFRITILTACQFVANAASRIAAGYFIKGQGYSITIFTFGCIQLVNLAYLFISVRETITRDQEREYTLKETLKRIKSVFKNSKNRRNIKLFLLSAMFLFYKVPLGGHSLQILYVLKRPLCWGPVLIGIYGALSGLSSQVAGLVSLKLLKRFPITDMVLAALGCLSAIGGCLVNAWATDDIFMYLVAVVSLLMALPPPLIRSTITCLLKSDEQGTVLAVVACFEVVSYLTLGPLINIVYQHTIVFMPGFAFIVCAGLEGVTLTLIMVYICHAYNENRASRLLSTSKTSLNCNV